MKDLFIVALDGMDREQVYSFMDKLNGKIPCVKIGLELFYKYGQSFVRELYGRYPGSKIFLDLKLHDIPYTIKRTLLSLKDLPLTFLSLHLSGGRAMLESAMRTAREALPHVKLLGVSYLTSLDEKDFFELQGLSPERIPEAFEKLFRMAIEVEIHGIILSSLELSLLRKMQGKISLLTICPGIRFQDEIQEKNIHDQSRILDPLSALKGGADYLVMGRSLTKALDLNRRLAELEKISCSISQDLILHSKSSPKG